MTAAELFEQLNQNDEQTQIEAKKASELGSSVMETICAFSNEPGLGGGWILLGVAPRENTFWPEYEPKGIADPDKMSQELASRCATEFNLPIRVQIESAIIRDKRVMAVYVPEVSASQKPVYLKKQGLPKGAFRRIGTTDQHCTDDDLLVLFQDRRGETFDIGVVPGSDLSHIDPLAVAEYRQIRSEVKPDAEELRLSDSGLLESLGCVTRSKGEYLPTVAGILLFGSASALRRFFPMIRVDYIRIPGRAWVRDPDRRFDTIEIRGPLIRSIRRAHHAILDDLPKAFSLPPGQLERQEIPVIPDRVIREAVVNAVMHRSYRVNGPIQIIRYSNRLEIRNPGHSLKSEERLGEPGSETRNPYLAAVLHETNLAETKGSGIRVMRESMTLAGLTPPTFESDRTGNQFWVTMLFHHFLTPEDWNWLTRFTDQNLTNEESRALVFVREAGAIKNQTYRDLNSVDTLNASNHLRKLRDRGLLEMKGKGAETYYIPTETLLEGWQSSYRSQSESAITQAGNLALETGKPASEAGNLPDKTGNLTTEAGKLTSEPQAPAHGNLKNDSLNTVPSKLAEDIRDLPKKASQQTMQDLIERLCRVRDWNLDELAQHFQRNRQYTLDKYVTPMVRDGRLVMIFPDQPNHPKQRYRSKTVETE